MLFLTRLASFVIVAMAGFAGTFPPNWTGDYAPCLRHDELLRTSHIDVGVRFATENSELARQFARAMDFWAAILDLDWRTVDSTECSIEVVDGPQEMFNSVAECRCAAARAQTPDRAGFQGWVAFNPAVRLTDRESYAIAIHEIGHLLGLPHSSSAASVMYFLPFENSTELDANDLRALAERHRLRAARESAGGSF